MCVFCWSAGIRGLGRRLLVCCLGLTFRLEASQYYFGWFALGWASRRDAEVEARYSRYTQLVCKYEALASRPPPRRPLWGARQASGASRSAQGLQRASTKRLTVYFFQAVGLGRDAVYLPRAPAWRAGTAGCGRRPLHGCSDRDHHHHHHRRRQGQGSHDHTRRDRLSAGPAG